MRQVRPGAYNSNASLEARCDAVLLGKLGAELARVYEDALAAPLPVGLQTLIERLDRSLSRSASRDTDDQSEPY